MKNLFFVLAVAVMLTSCGGEISKTPCECFEIKGGKTETAEKKWCSAKEASDETFKSEVKNCGTKSLGHNSKDGNSKVAKSAANGTYSVNAKKSSLKWTGRKVTGQHTGKISVKSGEFTLNDAGIPSAGKVVVDMTSITCTDIADKKSNGDLVGHLKNEDFFNVAEHEEAIFEITSTEKVQGSGAKLTGNLTIKGITKPCKGIITVIPSKTVVGQVNLSSAIKFDRTEYDIKYGSGKFFDNLGDKTIKDEVSLQVTLVGTPN